MKMGFIDFYGCKHETVWFHNNQTQTSFLFAFSYENVETMAFRSYKTETIAEIGLK